MTGRGKLTVAMIVLFIAAFVVPLALRQLPLPIRLVAGFSNFVAGTAIALLLWQRRGGQKQESNPDKP